MAPRALAGIARTLLAGTVVVGAALAGCAPKPVPPAFSEAPRVTLGDPGYRGELATDGPIATRISTAPANVTIFYGSEQKGSTETCGCPHRPRGSLARLDAYVDASRAANPTVPSVLVNAGYWLEDATGFDGQLRPDVTTQNRWMVAALRLGDWDALNVGYNDLAGLATLAPDGGPPLPLVSANVAGPGVRRWVIVQRGGLRVGITGITGVGATLTDVPGYTIGPPAHAAAVIDELAAQADVVVLLAYEATEAAKALAEHDPAIGVVIDAARHNEYVAPFPVGSAVWVLSQYQTLRAGELRLSLAGRKVVGALDRHIDLDPTMPDDPGLRTLSEKARAEIDAVQQKLYGQ